MLTVFLCVVVIEVEYIEICLDVFCFVVFLSIICSFFVFIISTKRIVA